jgi:HEAT repeat protein
MVVLLAITAAMLLLGACSGSPERAKQKSMEDLLEDMTNGSDQVKIAAIRELGKSNDPAVPVAIMVALKDESIRVRTAAVSVLAGSKNPKVAEELGSAVRDPAQNKTFRLAVARALAQSHDARAVEPLIQALSYAPGEASASLVELGPAAVPALIEALRHVETTEAASRALISIGEPAVASLINLLQHDKSARLAAARTLADMDQPSGNDALTTVLSSSDPELTAATYRFLIRQGKPGTEPRLIDVLNVYGRLAMADDFVSSGNAALKAAAEEWARKRNYPLAARTSDLPEVHWAGVDPSMERLALFHFDGSLNSASGTAPIQSTGVSFVAGKWGKGIAIGQGGLLTYPLKGNLDFRDGTIEMWISPKFDGADPVYARHNHPLLLYHAPTADQFLVSEGTFLGFYAGSVIRRNFKGAGGGDMRSWKAGSWHHIAFTYSSRTARQRLYLDGVLTVSNTGLMPQPDPGNGKFTVGCDPYANWTAFVLDEVLILNGEKGPDSIRRDAQRSAPFADL